MRRRRNRTSMAAMDQINVTPLLDLTFLLLIAFMITMPLMEYGTSVSPPEMNGSELPKENFITVELTKGGTFLLDGEAIASDPLREKLQKLSQRDPKPDLLVRGDGEQSYENVLNLLKLARECGFKDAVLVTQAEAGRK